MLASAFALPDESKTYASLLQQKRDIGYMIIPTARFSGKIKVTPQQIKMFYQQHQADFKTPEKINISYVEISPKMVTAQIKPSTAELQQYYKENRSNYTNTSTLACCPYFAECP